MAISEPNDSASVRAVRKEASDMPEPKTTCDVLADIAKQIRCGKPARWNDGQHFVCDDCMNSKHAGSQPKDYIQLRDWLAAHETLKEWEDFDTVDQNAAELLAGRPKPKHGWRCETREQLIETLQWDADWRAALKYIRADAMLRARLR